MPRWVLLLTPVVLWLVEAALVGALLLSSSPPSIWFVLAVTGLAVYLSWYALYRTAWLVVVEADSLTWHSAVSSHRVPVGAIRSVAPMAPGAGLAKIACSGYPDFDMFVDSAFADLRRDLQARA